MDDVGSLPLGSGDVDGADRAFRGHVGFDSAEVGLLAGGGNTGADIDAELHHLIAVFEKKLAKFRRGFPFCLLFDREIEGYH